MGGPPRYRIEHRPPDAASLIVAYADSRIVAEVRLVFERRRLLRRRERGAVVLVDQETGQDVATQPLLP